MPTFSVLLSIRFQIYSRTRTRNSRLVSIEPPFDVFRRIARICNSDTFGGEEYNTHTRYSRSNLPSSRYKGRRVFRCGGNVGIPNTIPGKILFWFPSRVASSSSIVTSSRDLRGPVNFRCSLAQDRETRSLIFLPLSPKSSLRGR